MTIAALEIPEDVRPDDSDRYAIIVLVACPECVGSSARRNAKTRVCQSCRGSGEQRERVAYVSETSLGLALVTLHEENQINGNDAIGVLDLREHRWIINPYGKRRPVPVAA
jgi:hypothetical protein